MVTNGVSYPHLHNMKHQYKVDISKGAIKIFINDILFVLIKESDFIGLQSWFETDNKFCIEYYTKTQSIFTEYDDFKKWKTMLDILAKQEWFNAGFN